MRRTTTRAGWWVAAAATLIGGAVWPGEAEGVTQDPFPGIRAELFVNATVIDGRGGAPRPSSSVLVWGGRIQGVGTEGSLRVPEGTVVVDLSGSYLIPGFIDVHASPRTAADLSALLAHGITGVRDGALPLDVFEARGRGAFGEDPSPAVYLGGPMLDAGSAARGVALESEAAAITEIERQAGGGAEFISISPNVPAEWLVGIMRGARRAEVPVWADRRGAGWLLALRAGAAVASPLVSGDPELLPEAERDAFETLAAEGGTQATTAWLERLESDGAEVDRAVTALLSNDATLAPLLASTAAPLDCTPEAAACPPATEAERARLRAAWPKAQTLVHTLHDHGVRMLVGSDAPRTTEWGRGFHREMRLLAGAGIPEIDVLGMATRNAAIALGVLHERGTIELGKRADFLVLEANPLADIRNAGRISLVVLGGRAWSLGPDGVWERVRFN